MDENLENESFLVKEMQAGNEKAFSALYLYYSPRLYINVVRMVRDPSLAEEIVQEVFTKIWLKKDSIQISENFAGYMYRVSQNLVHDFFRKLKNDRALLNRFRSFATENYRHVEESISHRESAFILKKAIDQLPPQQKKVYLLVREEGYTYKKAAEILGISSNTVKEYLVSGTKTIKSYILRNVEGSSFILMFLSAITGCCREIFQYIL